MQNTTSTSRLTRIPDRVVSWVNVTDTVIALHIGAELVENQPWAEVLADRLGVVLPRGCHQKGPRP